MVFALFSLSFFWVMYGQYIASLPFDVVGVIATLPLIYIVVYVVHKYKNVLRKIAVCS